MTTRSVYNKYIPIPTSELAAQMPMSARKISDCSNNLQHLIDSTAQHRIQWTRAVSDVTAFDTGDDYERAFTAVIPWTWFSQSRSASLIVMVYGQAVADTIYVTTTFHVGYTWPFTRDIDLMFEPCVYFQGSTDATVDTQLINTTYNLAGSEYMKNLSSAPRKYYVFDKDSANNDIFRAVNQIEVRMTVWFKGNGYLNYVGAREYLL